jgi:hypothetical protein
LTLRTPNAQSEHFGQPLDSDTPALQRSVWALFPAHGGCGASTVAALLDLDSEGLAVEVDPGDIVPVGWRPVVVARSTTYGCASSCDLISQWPAGLPPPWLVVMADAPTRPPQAARFYLRAIRDRTAGIATVPYLPRLRTVVSITEILDDRAVAKASRDLQLRLSAPRRAAP